jgi:hypothetical protein
MIETVGYIIIGIGIGAIATFIVFAHYLKDAHMR